MPKKDTTPIPRRIISRGREELRCQLSKVEIEDQRHEAMRLLDEVDTLEAEMSTIKAEHKRKSEKLAERLREARRAASDGTVKRDVDVESYVTSIGTVETIRLDTGEVIRTRPGSKAELNEELPMDLSAPPTEGQAFG